MVPEAEGELVARCQRGDWRAFEALLAPCRTRAYRLACRLTGSHVDAEDALQDALLAAFLGMRTFKGRSRFSTWFRTILTRAALDRAREGGRRRSEGGPGGGPMHGLLADGDDPATRAEDGELTAALDEALWSLPAELRAAVVLVAFEGMTYAEAARILECPEGTLAWRIAKARQRLSQLLAAHLDLERGANDAM